MGTRAHWRLILRGEEIALVELGPLKWTHLMFLDSRALGQRSLAERW
jgi:hypothetical protein